MNACSSDQIGLFRCFIPPFHLLCGGSSSTRTQRTPFRASNPSKICRVHCAGDRQGSLFWHIFLISVLLVLFAYLVGSWCGGSGRGFPLEVGAGEPVQAVLLFWWSKHLPEKGWQIAGFIAISVPDCTRWHKCRCCAHAEAQKAQAGVCCDAVNSFTQLFLGAVALTGCIPYGLQYFPAVSQT